MGLPQTCTLELKKFYPTNSQTGRQMKNDKPTPLINPISPMILISWNIRGMGAKIKLSSLRKLITRHDPSMVFIQETKLETINPKIINHLWKDSDFEWLDCPSLGNSGGIISVWKKGFFTLTSSHVDRNLIILTWLVPSFGLNYHIINIYNPCDVNLRAQAWDKLSLCWASSQLPCLLIGDFNETLDPNERGSQRICTNGSNSFKSFSQDLGLMEIPFANDKYTWFRGNSKSKLDRTFTSPEWIEHYPSIKASILKRSLSDHCPLLIQTHQKNWGPRPFRFINCWLTHPGCLKTIKAS